jgi:uncharacterized protein
MILFEKKGMNSIGFFEIQSSEPSREVAFYKAVFGWNFHKEESYPIEYYRIETPGTWGGLLKRPVPIPQGAAGTNAYVCSIQVADFDATHEAIIAAGGQIAMEKFAVPGKCWQGYFMDQDRNTFGVFQVDDAAK